MLSANLLVCDCICGPSLSLPKSTWNRGWKPFWITQKNSADCSETKEVQATCPLSHHESAAGTTRWLWVFDHRPISSSHPTSSYLLHLPLQFFLDHCRSEASNIFLSHLSPWRHRQCLKTTELQCQVKDHSLGYHSGYMKTGNAGARALKPKFKLYLTFCISFLPPCMFLLVTWDDYKITESIIFYVTPS